MKKLIAVYPGSFDPVTYGHLDILRRSIKIFEKIVIGITDNPRKSHLFSIEERIGFLERATEDLTTVSITHFNCLLVDFASQIGANAIIKGLRALSDFDYELQMSLTNRRLNKDVETFFMMASEESSFVSSTMIKEIAALQGDISSMVPDFVEEAIADRLSKKPGDQ
ncbi:MAG TPA: pantetheine-phosphate adenylyltransferase [Nitrospinota bacterium]|nr:pantetheine-phosphate adenylyltransferase [Nitrospinota bacterium]